MRTLYWRGCCGGKFTITVSIYLPREGGSSGGDARIVFLIICFFAA